MCSSGQFTCVQGLPAPVFALWTPETKGLRACVATISPPFGGRGPPGLFQIPSEDGQTPAVAENQVTPGPPPFLLSSGALQEATPWACPCRHTQRPEEPLPRPLLLPLLCPLTPSSATFRQPLPPPLILGGGEKEAPICRPSARDFPAPAQGTHPAHRHPHSERAGGGLGGRPWWTPREVPKLVFRLDSWHHYLPSWADTCSSQQHTPMCKRMCT